jgi:hypothetical protein
MIFLSLEFKSWSEKNLLMKNNLLSFILFLFISTIPSSLFAQGPVDPGVDPLSNPVENTVAPTDSIMQKNTDTVRVIAIENLIRATLQPYSTGTQSSYTNSEGDINRKYFLVKCCFFQNLRFLFKEEFI